MAGEKRQAAQRARFREVAADVMDIGRGYSDRQGASRVLDGATDLAVAAATRATAAGRPLRPNERREVRHEVLGEQAGRPEQAQGRRLGSPREWLEAMTSEQRRNVEKTSYFRRLNTEQQARLLRLRDDVDEIDARAELLLAQEREDDWLAEQSAEGDLYEDGDEDDFEERLGERRADELEAESDAVFGAWAEPMGVEEAFGLPAPAHEPSLSDQVGWEDEAE